MSTSFSSSPQFYVDGGTLQPGVPSYVERAADRELHERCLSGDFCYVLTPRQTGKSSLMARTAKRLQEKDIRTADVSLEVKGSTKGGIDASDWYYGIAREIHRKLRIPVDLTRWWSDNAPLPAPQRFMEFFRDLVLGSTPATIVIFFDEIDSTINLPFSDDFFAAIRACYNARATEPEYRRLSFVLLGVASPSQLIKDPTRTPFNIGYRIELTDFTRKESEPLAQGLSSDTTRSTQLLERILYWTGGHPYLTQRLCKLVSEDTIHADPEMTVDRLVEKEFLAQEASQNEINFQRVRELTAGSPESRSLLRLYQRIYRGQQVLDDPLSPIQTGLKLSGLVVVREGRVLTVRNRIYARVFSDDWAKAAMPGDWNRRIAVSSVAMLLLSFGFWYEILQPRPYIDELMRASEDYPAQAYTELHKIPGYAGKADELLAEYWDRQAIRFAAIEDRDRTLFTRLQGLTAQDSDPRRREAALLVEGDYNNLTMTYRHSGPVNAVAFSPDGKLAFTGSGDGTARLWRTDTGTLVGPAPPP